MEFERDRLKAEQNRKKHRVPFDDAVTVFYNPLAATFDDPDAVQARTVKSSNNKLQAMSSPRLRQLGCT